MSASDPNGIGRLVLGAPPPDVIARIAAAITTPPSRTATAEPSRSLMSERRCCGRDAGTPQCFRPAPTSPTGRVIKSPKSGPRGYRSRRMQRRYRVVIAKPGLDGHDRGAKVIARALRDGGFEVIYTGLHQTPEQIAETALQEDADAVGLSLLSGAHMTLFPRVLELLRERGLGEVVVFGGGIIPDADIPKLTEIGVAQIFTPGATLNSIHEWLEQALDAREAQPAG